MRTTTQIYIHAVQCTDVLRILHCRVYCEECVLTLGGENVLEQVKVTDPWHCFICSPVKRGLVEGKAEWQNNLVIFCNPPGAKEVLKRLLFG